VAILLEKNRNMTKKDRKSNPNGYLSYAIASFRDKWKNAFRLRRRERIEVQATTFIAVCLHFRSSFFALFFRGFCTPLGCRINGAGGRGGTPLNEFN